MLSDEVNISIAVSVINTHRELIDLLDKVSIKYDVAVDRSVFERIWRDIKRVPTHYAVSR
jgi:hypothetical protein